MTLDVETKFKWLAYTPCVAAPLSVIGSTLTLTSIYRTKIGAVRAKKRQRSESRSKDGEGANTRTRNASYGQAEVEQGADSTGDNSFASGKSSLRFSRIGRSSDASSASSQKGGQLHTMHRLMIGISVFDIVVSLAAMFGPALMPAETGFPGALGTFGSCTWQGFFFQLGVTSLAYNAMLLLYFVLVIRYNVRDTVMSKNIEPLLHAIPLLFHISLAVVGLVWQVYNPTGIFCWVNAYPPGCVEDPTVPCLRGGERADFFGLNLLVYPTFVWTGTLVVCTVIIAFTVWSKYRKSEKFAFEGSTGRGNRTIEKRTKRVISQCFLYAGVFINTIIWSTIQTILDLSGVEYDPIGTEFWLGVLAVTFYPLQGLFNFFIYIRPRYLAIREKHTSSGRLFAIREAIWYPTASPQDRQERSTGGRGDKSNSRASASSTPNLVSPSSSSSFGGTSPQNTPTTGGDNPLEDTQE